MNKELHKSLQDVQYEILLKFDEYCKEQRLHYFLFAGTLLGAVRHNGFIPWDDDIDICMLRSEYDKFVELTNKEFIAGYFVQNKWSEPNFFKHYTKIRKDNTLFWQGYYQVTRIHQGISISVFPLDIFIRTKRTNLVQFFYGLFYRFDARWRIDVFRGEIYKIQKNKIRYVFYSFMYYLLKLFPKRISDTLMDRLFKMYASTNTLYIGHLTNSMTKERLKRFIFKKEWFEETTYCQFRDKMFPIPKHYHEILSTMYGDYMELPPENERIPKHNAIEIKLKTDKFIGDITDICD